jgi:hypothetical protein
LVNLAFAAVAPRDLPEVLEDAAVESVGAGRYRIWTEQREWILAATGCHLHRDVSVLFYRAVAPRIVPWSKRVFWRVVLALAARPSGKRLLLALRRR